MFTQGGKDHSALTSADIFDPSEAFRAPMDYYAHAPNSRELLSRCQGRMGYDAHVGERRLEPTLIGHDLPAGSAARLIGGRRSNQIAPSRRDFLLR